jgi:putative alpha-1,2-mannosidase
MVSPYSYAYVGRPDRIAEVVFGVKTYSFSPGRGGVAGNIDSGGECGWYVWSALGLHPVAGQPVYILGSPTFEATTTQLGPSASLTITRAGRGLYIQAGTFDSKPLAGRAWLHVAEVHGAGKHTLALTMGPKPPPAGQPGSWGSVLPPSFAPPK